MDIVLVPGLWLDGSAWDAVVPELERLGHRAVPVLLPGQGDGNDRATLADQTAAVVAAVDSVTTPAVVVGHSAAATLAWIAADRRPGSVSQVVMVGGFPRADGEVYADFFECVDGAMPFPGWEAFDGPDAADVDDALRATVASTAIPVPEPVATGVVGLTDDRRFGVPVTVVCPEFSPADARAWVASGDLPELSRAEHVDYVDLDSGHWPMFTAPAALAALLADIATTSVGAFVAAVRDKRDTDVGRSFSMVPSATRAHRRATRQQGESHRPRLAAANVTKVRNTRRPGTM